MLLLLLANMAQLGTQLDLSCCKFELNDINCNDIPDQRDSLLACTMVRPKASASACYQNIFCVFQLLSMVTNILA